MPSSTEPASLLATVSVSHENDMKIVHKNTLRTWLSITGMLAVFALVLSSLSLYPISLKASSVSAVATGNGIAVWPEDVDQIRDFFTSQNMHTGEEEYLRQAIQYVLFEEMAKRLDLEPLNIEQYVEDSLDLPMRIGYAEAYIRHILREAEVDPVIIESYFYAFPWQFQIDVVSQDGIHEIPDEVAVSIRNLLVHQNSNFLIRSEYDILFEKFGVVIHK